MRGMKRRFLIGAWVGRKPLAFFVLFVHTIYMDYLHEQHTVHLIVYHIIWCPKRRRRILVGKDSGTLRTAYS